LHTQNTLPFRAEHIGSLLRPAALREARRRFARQEIDQAALTAAEDHAIEEAVRLQARAGLRLATDGEFRRASYHGYFYGRLGDISFEAPSGEAGSRGAQPIAVIKSRIAWGRPIHAADFAYLRARTKALPKITIPGPCALHFRGGDAAVMVHAYRDVDQFWDDIVAAFQSELRSLAAAGCTYVQIDETAFAKFGDADVRTSLRARGDDPDALIDKYIDITNRAVAGVSRISIGMHLSTARSREYPVSASACISAAATAPGNGTRKEATRRLPRSCSTGSRSSSSFSNTTPRARVTSHR
jgi:5-methyltetrahydropteroyltriglutamate--homocysteine methyltransferase